MGKTIRVQGPFRHYWESVLTPLLDDVIELDGVNPDCSMVLISVSLHQLVVFLVHELLYLIIDSRRSLSIQVFSELV
jgi:hypothetical protein